jgi:hypothetical protein
MTTLAEAVNQDDLLFAVTDNSDPEDSIDRFAAELFVLPDGIGWADNGWPEAQGSYHPFHSREGDIIGDMSPWEIGDVSVRVMEHGDALAGEANSWLRYRQGPEGKLMNRKRAWVLLVLDLFPESDEGQAIIDQLARGISIQNLQGLSQG